MIYTLQAGGQGRIGIKDCRWSQAYKGSNSVVSNNDLTADTSPSGFCVRSTVAHSNGKRYVEFVIDVISTGGNQGPYLSLGIDGGDDFGTYAPAPGWFWNVRQSITQSYVSVNPPGAYHAHGVCAAGDVLAFAWDADSGKLWTARNGTWNSGDPAAGTTPCFSTVTGNLYLWTGGAGKVTARFSPTNFSYTPPSGFVAWQS